MDAEILAFFYGGCAQRGLTLNRSAAEPTEKCKYYSAAEPSRDCVVYERRADRELQAIAHRGIIRRRVSSGATPNEFLPRMQQDD